MKTLFFFFICIIFIFLPIVSTAENQDIAKNIELLKAKDIAHQLKWQAKIELVKIGRDAGLPLIDALKDEDAKYYAIRALGEIGDERAVELLSEILLDKNYGPRRYAAIALGRIRSKKAIPALKKALEDVNYVMGDALTALQYIDPQEGNLYLQKILAQQNPNGLEIKLLASRMLNNLTFEVTFRNISPLDYYIYWPQIYQASLIAQDKSGRFIRPLLTVQYSYVMSPSDYHLVRASKVFSATIKGKIKDSPPAILSRSSIEIDWWDILYPNGPFKAIDFGDTELDVGILNGQNLKMYFIFEQGETAHYWGNKFGLDNVWTGKVISNPVEIAVN